MKRSDAEAAGRGIFDFGFWILAAAVLLAILAVPLGAAESVLPFIKDDYAKAVAEAKAKNVPIFVDAWAPW
jgi:hypothetical protein